MTRTLPLTAAEAEHVTRVAAAGGGTVWLVREGQPDDPIHPDGIWQCEGCGRTYPEYINGCVNDHGAPRGVRLAVPQGPLPPAVFVAACEPCAEPRCGGKRGWVARWICEWVNCEACRIELVGPCPNHANCAAGDSDCPCGWLTGPGNVTAPVVTVAHGYAVGQPLPIVTYDVKAGPGGAVGDIGTPPNLLMMLSGQVLHIKSYPDKVTDATADLAHYGDPASLVGKWALQVEVVA